jgi:hypothetical protein
MGREGWSSADGGEYTVRVPAGWTAERDVEEGGLEISRPQGSGVLHLVAFTHSGGASTDPAEELYAFLEEQEIELQEDEVEDLTLDCGSELALCEYLEEEEDGAAYWMVGVAALPEVLVFAHYSCDAGEEREERAMIREVLRTIRPSSQLSDGTEHPQA